MTFGAAPSQADVWNSGLSTRCVFLAVACFFACLSSGSDVKSCIERSGQLTSEVELHCPPARGVEIDRSRLQYRPDSLEFALVSDLDKSSRDPQRFLWHSLLKKGALQVEALSEGADPLLYRLEWIGEQRLESGMAVKNRSMELSELVGFRGRHYAVCDITGLVFEIDLQRGRAFQRYVLADGDGEDMKPFKSEWATIKDGLLVVGSMGREWVNEAGAIESFNNQWVKTIDQHGSVESINWRPVYEALRAATGTLLPGYLWHEAVVWDPRLRLWIVLPRKASKEPYAPERDETQGTNLLLLASEDFSNIEVRHLGPLEPDWGFTALRKVPGTNDTYLALKVLEIGSRTETKITVFDLQGRFLLDPPFQHVDVHKYEGVDFIGNI